MIKGVIKFYKKHTGQVYWAFSKKIDANDHKDRRQYVVVRDSGNNVAVAKIRGYNGNEKNNNRLYILDQSKYPLIKKCGVDRKVYKRRADTRRLLQLEDRQVFEQKSSFLLSSHDTHRVRIHTGIDTKKGRKK